jgi:exosortase
MLNPLHRHSRALFALAAICCFGSLFWAYWTTLQEISQRWAHDPQYSHGYFVPAFALFLLWHRRGYLSTGRFGPSWWGLPVLAAGLLLRLVGAYFHFVWVDQVSLLPCLAGICLLLIGRRGWRWAQPAILFLVLMIPLPYSLGVALADPLRRLATVSSTFLLQTVGMPAVAEGNVILIGEAELDVAEACSGLRMLVTFFALSTAVALLSGRPIWERIALVVSAIPIALVANVLRVTAMGLFAGTAGTTSDALHDVSGWLMMPLALGILWIELGVLKRLLIQRESASPIGPAVWPQRA